MATQATNVSHQTRTGRRKFITVNDHVWADLKIHCIREGIKLPNALNDAIQLYLKSAKSGKKAA